MKHTVPYVNWHMALADVIEKAQDGDEIVCHSKAMADLGERARLRMCPEKHLMFSVSEE
jgi:hypothetical protein